MGFHYILTPPPPSYNLSSPPPPQKKKKKKKKKKLVKFAKFGPPLTNLSGSAHALDMYNESPQGRCIDLDGEIHNVGWFTGIPLKCTCTCS